MLPCLGHGAVWRGDDEDSTVHLGCTGDHVLDVVGVAGAVDVSIVTLSGLILYVGDGDGEASSLLFRGVVDRVVGSEGCTTLHAKHLGDSSGQSGLSVVDVTDGAHVDVGLSSFESLFSHFMTLL